MLILHLQKQREKLHKHCQCQDKCLQVFFLGDSMIKFLGVFLWSNILCDLSIGERLRTLKALELYEFPYLK